MTSSAVPTCEDSSTALEPLFTPVYSPKQLDGSLLDWSLLPARHRTSFAQFGGCFSDNYCAVKASSNYHDYGSYDSRRSSPDGSSRLPSPSRSVPLKKARSTVSLCSLGSSGWSEARSGEGSSEDGGGGDRVEVRADGVLHGAGARGASGLKVTSGGIVSVRRQSRPFSTPSGGCSSSSRWRRRRERAGGRGSRAGVRRRASDSEGLGGGCRRGSGGDAKRKAEDDDPPKLIRRLTMPDPRRQLLLSPDADDDLLQEGNVAEASDLERAAGRAESATVKFSVGAEIDWSSPVVHTELTSPTGMNAGTMEMPHLPVSTSLVSVISLPVDSPKSVDYVCTALAAEVDRDSFVESSDHTSLPLPENSPVSDAYTDERSMPVFSPISKFDVVGKIPDVENRQINSPRNDTPSSPTVAVAVPPSPVFSDRSDRSPLRSPGSHRSVEYAEQVSRADSTSDPADSTSEPDEESHSLSVDVDLLAQIQRINPEELTYIPAAQGGFLGKGASGVVHKTIHKPTGTVLAVKTMKLGGHHFDQEHVLGDLMSFVNLAESECPFLVGGESCFGYLMFDSSPAL